MYNMNSKSKTTVKSKYILVRKNSLNRVENRYGKHQYAYAKFAQHKALTRSLKEWQDYVRDLKEAKAHAFTLHRDAPEEIVVMSEAEFAKAIEGMGEWKTNLRGNGKPIWVAHDTPACCDPSTETYHCM